MKKEENSYGKLSLLHRVNQHLWPLAAVTTLNHAYGILIDENNLSSGRRRQRFEHPWMYHFADPTSTSFRPGRRLRLLVHDHPTGAGNSDQYPAIPVILPIIPKFCACSSVWSWAVLRVCSPGYLDRLAVSTRLRNLTDGSIAGHTTLNDTCKSEAKWTH